MSADAVVFEELLTELDEKLEQGATNRVVGELAAIAARIQINLQTLSQEERDRILGLLLKIEDFWGNAVNNFSILIEANPEVELN